MTIYGTPAQLKLRMSIDDDLDDVVIAAALETASRSIDRHCHRTFFVTKAVRTYTPNASGLVFIDDLLSVTTLKSDTGDRSYSTTWANTDYDLLPEGAPYASPPEPFTYIRTAPQGGYLWTAVRRGVQIDGNWGYYDVREQLAATVFGSHNGTVTVIALNDSAEFEAGQTIWIGSEQLEVTDVNNSPHAITVKRAKNGTTAASMLSGATIQLATFPVISNCCYLLASRYVKRKDAPFGIAGNADAGMMRLTITDPDVKRDLWDYRRMRP